MNSENAPKREAEVSNQMSQLGKTIEVIIESVNSLKLRFAPILKPSPAGRDEKAKEGLLLVPLAAIIRQLHYRLVELNSDIQEIIKSCEL